MKTSVLFLSFVSSVFFSQFAIADGAAPAPAPTVQPKVWSNVVHCSIMQIMYFDFTQANPFKDIINMGAGPKMNVDIQTGEYTLGQATIAVPNTDLQVDIDNLSFINTIGGKSLARKSMSGRVSLRQNGKIVASASLDDASAPATNSAMSMELELQDPDAVQAEMQRTQDMYNHINKALAPYIQAAAPGRSEVVDQVSVLCLAESSSN